MHLQENILFDLDLRDVAQYPGHHVTYAPANLMLLHPTIKEKMHLQEYTLYDLDTKCCHVPSTSCELCTYKS